MATYYIDPTQASDGAGTESDPFNTWASVSWAAGNSYLQMSGTTWAGKLAVNASGTLGNEIYLGIYGGTERAVIDADGETRAIQLFNRSYVIVENFHGMNSTDSTFQAANGTGDVFRNCVATNFAASGFFISNCTGLLIEECEAHSALGSFSAGVQLVVGTNTTIVRGVTVYGISGDGIIAISSNSNQIIGCRVGPMVKDAIALEDSDSCLVYNNIVYQDNFWGASYPSIKLGDNFGAGVGAALNVIRNNCFYHLAADGGALAATNCADDNTIENNNYYVPNSTGVFAWHTTNDVTVPTGDYTYAEWVAFGKYDQASFNVDPGLDGNYVVTDSTLIGGGVRWWSGSNPIGADGEPFADWSTSIGGIQSQEVPFHPVNL